MKVENQNRVNNFINILGVQTYNSMHEVRFSIPYRQLGKSDIVFNVRKNGEKIGSLRISKGAVVWFPKDKKIGHKVGWEAFDDFMKSKRKVEKR